MYASGVRGPTTRCLALCLVVLALKQGRGLVPGGSTGPARGPCARLSLGSHVVLRLRGGGKRRAEADGAPPGGCEQSGSGRGREVVFPRDCTCLRVALRRCAGAAADRELAGGCDAGGQTAQPPSKRKRAPISEQAHTGAGGPRESCALLVEFGRHEVGEETLSVTGNHTWSIRGIGDVSGNVDIVALRELAASRECYGEQLPGVACRPVAKIIRQSDGRGAAAKATQDEDSAWAGGQVLEIALPNTTWPLLPASRYDIQQTLRQLACVGAGEGQDDTEWRANARGRHDAVMALAHSAAGGRGPIRAIRAHKHIRDNPFELVLQAPEETEV